MNHKCPLCHSDQILFYHEDKRRTYLHCERCDLVFVPSQYHLDNESEKKEYDLHENNPLDSGYRKFLSRLCTPLLARLNEGSSGLDFGCGPGPALAMMLEEKGHKVTLYDYFYFKDETVFNNKFDFICSTEVFEHLRNPALEIERLFKVLNNKGTLALMTKLVIDKDAFAKWHYIQDQTHICFYSKKTFQFIASKYNCELEFVDKDVIFLRHFA